MFSKILVCGQLVICVDFGQIIQDGTLSEKVHDYYKFCHVIHKLLLMWSKRLSLKCIISLEVFTF